MVRRKVENLPRTGIEYPMMRDLGHPPFLSPQLEYEQLVDRNNWNIFTEEYLSNDTERVLGSKSFEVVYDYIEPSPHYEGENSKFGPYIDEKDLIELPNPADQGNGSINEPYQKRYYFNP